MSYMCTRSMTYGTVCQVDEATGVFEYGGVFIRILNGPIHRMEQRMSNFRP